MRRETAEALNRLRRELALVDRWLTMLRSEPKPEELESGGDNTPLSEIADATQLAEDREVRMSLIDSLVVREGRLRWAIERASRGRYGLCVNCGEPIGPGRLRAVPEAERCLTCQASLEDLSRSHGPGAYEWLEAGERLQERTAFD